VVRTTLSARAKESLDPPSAATGGAARRSAITKRRTGGGEKNDRALFATTNIDRLSTPKAVDQGIGRVEGKKRARRRRALPYNSQVAPFCLKRLMRRYQLKYHVAGGRDLYFVSTERGRRLGRIKKGMIHDSYLKVIPQPGYCDSRILAFAVTRVDHPRPSTRDW